MLFNGIHQPGDRVRIEIELALKHDVAIFPVLVEGAAMPREKELPPSIAPFYRPNAAPLDSHSFDYHIERLLNDLERVAGGPAAEPQKGGGADAGHAIEIGDRVYSGPDADAIADALQGAIDTSDPAPPRLAIVAGAIGAIFIVAAFALFGHTLFTMDPEPGEGPPARIGIAAALFFVGFVIILATSLITAIVNPRTVRRR